MNGMTARRTGHRLVVVVAAVAAAWGARPACLVDGAPLRAAGEGPRGGGSGAACPGMLRDAGARTCAAAVFPWADAPAPAMDAPAVCAVRALRGGSSYAAVPGSGLRTPTSKHRPGYARAGSRTPDSQRRESPRPGWGPGQSRRDSPPGSARPSRIKPLGGSIRTPRPRGSGGESLVSARPTPARAAAAAGRRGSDGTMAPNGLERLVGAVSVVRVPLCAADGRADAAGRAPASPPHCPWCGPASSMRANRTRTPARGAAPACIQDCVPALGLRVRLSRASLRERPYVIDRGAG